MATIPVNNPEIPFLGEIPGGFHPGMIIRLRGQVHGSQNWCQIFIQQGPALKPRDDVMLHLSIRPENNAIVRNHYQNKKWGNEEKSGHSPIRANQHFEILILAEAMDFKIAVNGQHFCQFNHRLPLNLAKFISIEGACEIQYILMENDVRTNVVQHQSVQPSAPNMSMFEIKPSFNILPSIATNMIHGPSHSQFSIASNMPNIPMLNKKPVQAYPITVAGAPNHNISYNPSLPFSCPIIGGIRVGMMIKIKGQISHRNGRCVINIQDSPCMANNEKILLHISIRLDEDEIVRNHFNIKWGHEERHGENPIEIHKTFEILILAEPALYKIAVNGKHFCTFNHRLPLEMGKFFVISGKCQIQEAQVVVNVNY